MSIETLKNATEQILPNNGLEEKLKSNKRLRVKLGFDPTAPDLHLGHAVVLEKLKDFQDLGHEVVFVIGDFTARIGDPSGRSKTRPELSDSEIKANAKTYFDQVGKILDVNKTKVEYNSHWYSSMGFDDFIKIAGKTTLARIVERDDFQRRMQENQPIGFHELFYPIMQGYDSVELKADVELGGTDQTFNILMGRFMQEQYGQDPQVAITMPILEGLDGTNKMSKSLSNYIALQEDPKEAYGKLMSIPDTLMLRYFKVLLRKSDSELASMKDTHPMKLKKQMAFEVVKKFWGEKEAVLGQETFEALFQKQDYSKAIEVDLSGLGNPVWVVDLLKELGAIKGSSEAKRLIEANSVHINDTTINDFKAQVSWKSGVVIKVGKHRIYKIR